MSTVIETASAVPSGTRLLLDEHPRRIGPKSRVLLARLVLLLALATLTRTSVADAQSAARRVSGVVRQGDTHADRAWCGPRSAISRRTSGKLSMRAATRAVRSFTNRGSRSSASTIATSSFSTA